MNPPSQHHTRRKESAFARVLKARRGKRGALIPLLQQSQGIFGYLPEDALTRIARALSLSPAEVYGVATFYGQFRLFPAGRHLITVCHGTACHVASAERISETIGRLLKINPGATTPDRRFTLQHVACLGCCSLSPVMMINADVYGRVAPAGIPAILERYR
ncbi:MAG: NADH-quinone oxidoreductase subunit NuoE [Candidatus Aureabacteria bacterium]|nr:NADH-quinone oxidoreductase subunit NuoE [Candidatus Auribacterota bacterium]